MPITEADYRALLLRTRGQAVVAPALKPHKYNAKRVTVDGHTFPSLWEAKCYTALRWRFLAGQITEPLLQVRFSLGEHYGKERAYVADFAFVELRSGTLMVADAKGYATEEYKRKRETFRCVYGFSISEMKQA